MEHVPTSRSEGYDALLDRIQQLEDRLAKTEAALATSRAERPEPPPTRSVERGAPALGRRALLRGAGVAAGAAAGSAILLSPAQSAADDNDPILAGQTTASTTYTGLMSDIPAGPYASAFGVIDRSLAYFPGSAALAAHSKGRFDNAVFGYHEGTGNGACGQADGAGATGVLGYAPNGFGGTLQGGRAHVRLPPSGLEPTARVDFHDRGELIVDANGDLWICTEPGTPGTWQRLGGPGYQGLTRMLDNPTRIYETRPGFPPFDVPKGALVDGEERDVDAGYLNVIPLGAIAVLLNITVTNTSALGWVALWRAGIPWPGTSNLNWSSAGTTIANSAIVALSVARLLRLRSAGSTDVIIDIVGYIMRNG